MFGFDGENNFNFHRMIISDFTQSDDHLKMLNNFFLYHNKTKISNFTNYKPCSSKMVQIISKIKLINFNSWLRPSLFNYRFSIF